MKSPAPATEFFEEDFDLAYPPGIEKHYWTRARNRIIEHQLTQCGLPRARILEIGCGKGIVVDYLRKRDYDCSGVELAKVKPLETVRDYLFPGTDATALPAHLRESFNVFLLLDVIEHLENPVSFLKQILPSFPNLTYGIITVPARPEIWSNYDEFYRHYRRYTLETLRETMEPIGARVLDIRYFFRLLYWPARWMAKTKKERSVRLSAPRNSMIFIHYLISQMCQADYFALPKRARGTSLICRIQLR